MFKYPQIKGFFWVSSVTLQNIPELRNKLFDVAFAEPYMGEYIPGSYINLINKIEEEKTKTSVITREKMVKLGESVGLTAGQTEMAFLFLNDIGVLYYSQQMSKFIVLEPRWLIDALTRVITAQPASDISNGIFSRAAINKIWEGYQII